MLLRAMFTIRVVSEDEQTKRKCELMINVAVLPCWITSGQVRLRKHPASDGSEPERSTTGGSGRNRLIQWIYPSYASEHYSKPKFLELTNELGGRWKQQTNRRDKNKAIQFCKKAKDEYRKWALKGWLCVSIICTAVQQGNRESRACTDWTAS